MFHDYLIKIIGDCYQLMLSLWMPIVISLNALSSESLNFLFQNVDSIIFKEVMHELARRLGHQGKHSDFARDEA